MIGSVRHRPLVLAQDSEQKASNYGSDTDILCGLREDTYPLCLSFFISKKGNSDTDCCEISWNYFFPLFPELEGSKIAKGLGRLA